MPYDPHHALRETLSQLDNHLDREYASSRIFYEADLHHSTIIFLRTALAAAPGTWIIGSSHWFMEWRPDIVCYYLPSIQDLEFFVTNFNNWQHYKFAVGVLEIKFAAEPRRDLPKLSELQSRYRRRAKKPLIAWLVYGDHFNSEVYARYERLQCRRQVAIERWVKHQRLMRGSTILRLGLVKDGDDYRARRVRECFNRGFWIHDGHRKERRRDSGRLRTRG